ncbi:VWA domain-containing protein [Poseidonibacter lekithochrous]|uniref:VWA domain-containing protein n=1 Tax=Poseidonibacter TaxID=2321187 RepID=UPI001C094278|nr:MULTISPECIES: VWA domain-containing protein [Poseidonibacter]MBU3015670.1 VWA domain-containing protein [Poseidonibacter lekithochrous]MDO6828971.1 VWA domain-containing protein [Poseidonibacter sp. 1_MG-2023]
MQFLYINVIYLMLIPSIILMILIIKKKNTFDKYFSKEVLDKLSVSSQYFSNKARNITLFIALLLITISLARPVTNEKTHDSKQQLNAVVIAIDVSKSMMANDIYPNRLEFAKKKLLDIIDTSKNNALGVILFAKSSFLLSPVTQDFTSLKILIENLDTGINFDNGTNIYSTLETTNKLLKNYKSKNLILLSDGADKKEFNEEIEFANKNNINIYVIATATKKGSAIKLKDGNYLVDAKGNIVTLGLNEHIKTLSMETNGGYINYSLDSNDITQVLTDINSKSQKQEFKEKRFKTYTELFYYPLSLGLIFLLIAFSSLPTFKTRKKKTIISIFAVFISLNINQLQASIFDFKTIEEANKAYKTENYKEAIKKYSSLEQNEQTKYNLANSLYKEGKYKKAIKKYKEIQTNDKNFDFQKLHNLGNSYVKAGNLEKAKTAYENALKLKNDKQTKENLDLVNKALDKKKEENKDKKDKKNNKESKDKNKNTEKKESEKNKEDNNKEDKKKEENKQKNKSQDKKEQKNLKPAKPHEISDLEEQKWLKQLENQKTNSLMKKMESKKETNTLENPW